MMRWALLLLSGCATVNPVPEITGHHEPACQPQTYERRDARIEWEDPRIETADVDTGVTFVRGHCEDVECPAGE